MVREPDQRTRIGRCFVGAVLAQGCGTAAARLTVVNVVCKCVLHIVYFFAEWVVYNIYARVRFLLSEEIAKHSTGSTGTATTPTAAAAATGTVGTGGMTVAHARAAALAALAAPTAPVSPPTPSVSLVASALPFGSVKEGVVDAVNELLDEIESSASSVAMHALTTLTSKDAVLTRGLSNTVVEFLLAAKSLKCEVYVAEGSPRLAGHWSARRLAEKMVTALIPDSAISSVAHRIQKILIGARAVGCDGSVVAEAGTGLLIAVARMHKIPVICVTSALKVSEAW